MFVNDGTGETKLDYETRCAREYRRKLVREALGDYRATFFGEVDAQLADAWNRVKRLYAERHQPHVTDEIVRGSFRKLMERDATRWAYNQETSARRKAVKA